MLQVVDSEFIQTLDDIEKEFPGCHVLVRLDCDTDLCGHLCAVSEEPETHEELCRLRDKYPADTIFYIGGVYKNGCAVGVQNFFG